MKTDNKKIQKFLIIFFSVIIIFLFLDFALGVFLEGWNNPK